jgi:putative drug exporter of the RND superfamily
MSALARWCYQHRKTVVGLWVVLLLALGGAYQATGTSYSEAFNLPGTESTKALELLQKSLPAASGDSDQIVIHVDQGSVKDAAVQTKVSAMLGQVAKLPSVAGVTSMYSPEGATQISADGRTAYATVAFDDVANELDLGDIEKVIDTAQAARSDTLQVELGGQAIQQATQAPPGSSELIGIVAAAIILFIAFGSLLGMLLPIVIAMTGVGGGLLTIGLLSHTLSLSSVAPTLASLIGLGVGIDYALFVVTRHRAGLQGGLEPEEAAVRSLNTSGRAVLFAGGTVVIALLGLLVLRLNFLDGLGIGSAVTVAYTVLSAVTLLPALLGFFGHRLISKKQKAQLAETGPRAVGATGVWARWAGFVEHNKAVLSAGVVLIIALLSIPTLGIRLGASDAGNDKTGTTTRSAYDLLADGFGPGSNGPLQLVAEVKGAADVQAFDRLLTTVKSTENVASVQALPGKPDAPTRIAIVVPRSAPQAAQTSDLIDHLRDDVVPPAEAGTGLQVYVGGSTAIFKDFSGVLTGKLPLFLGVIIALGFLLLTLAFRSILVPLTAAVMNVVAAGASFGVIVAIFQWGWGSSLVDFGGAGPVEAFVPVIMLAILFGLSMDYQVFLVSRMHEEWVHSHDNERAVRIGQAETGRVITAAAMIMILVFLSFCIGGTRVIAEFGLGLAVAVAIDAFLLRTVLVPALMHLFGSANWWLPGWLDRILPHVSVEGPPQPEATRPGPPLDGDAGDGRRSGDELIGSPRP